MQRGLGPRRKLVVAVVDGTEALAYHSCATGAAGKGVGGPGLLRTISCMTGAAGMGVGTGFATAHSARAAKRARGSVARAISQCWFCGSRTVCALETASTGVAWRNLYGKFGVRKDTHSLWDPSSVNNVQHGIGRQAEQ